MKTNQIKKYLKNVSNKFIDEAFISKDKKIDAKMKKLFIKNSFITGGCIPSLIVGEYINDIDIYITKMGTAQFIIDYFIEIAEKNCSKKFCDGQFTTYFYDDNKQNKYFVNFVSPNAISFNGSPKIQIIGSFFGSPKNIVEAFDFAHIKSYYIIHTGELCFEENLHEILFNKEIIYTGSDYPLSSMMRVQKLIKKGWTISAYFNLLIAMDLQKHDFTNKNVIINQLTGIDPLLINSRLHNLSNDTMNIDSRIIDIINVFTTNPKDDLPF